MYIVRSRLFYLDFDIGQHRKDYDQMKILSLLRGLTRNISI